MFHFYLTSEFLFLSLQSESITKQTIFPFRMNANLTKVIQSIFDLSYKIHGSLMEEIIQLDESLNRNRKNLQQRSIAVVNDYIKQKNAISSSTKRLIKQNVLSEDIANELDDLKERFDAITDSTWYTLNEMEALVHERIEDVRKTFSNNMNRIVDGFLHDLRPIFEEIKIAGQEYYRLVGEKYDENKQKDNSIEKAINFDRNLHWETSLKIQDYFFDCVNEWKIKTLEDYER